MTESGLQKINSKVLEILWEIPGSLYAKYIYFKQYNIDLKRIVEDQKERRKLKKARNGRETG